MRTLRARTNFNFNDRWLSEFGATLYNTNKEDVQDILPNSRHIVQELNLIDGSIYLGKNLEPLVIPLNILFKEEFDIDEFVEWISIEEGGWLYFPDEDRKIQVVLNSGINISNRFGNGNYYGKLEIEFIAYEPYWYEIEPATVLIENPVRGEKYGFYNDGNLPSKPIIELKCVGEKTNFAIGFNNYEIEIDRFTQNITIDTRYGTITTYLDGKEINKYSSYKVIGGYHPRQMIETEPGKHNSFWIIRGEVTEIKVTPNVRWKS